MATAARLALCTLILLLPVVVNGQPFLYFDTASYLSRPERAVAALADALGFVAPTIFGSADGVSALSGAPSTPVEGYLVGGRSVFYGLAVWSALALGLPMLLPAVQAAVTVAVLWLVWTLLPAPRHASFVVAILLLAVLTPAGFFVGLLTPDAFAPLVILAVALLACAWDRLEGRARAFLSIVLLFGLLAHTSHALTAICLLAGLVLVRAVWPAARRAVSRQGIAVAGGAFAVALGLNAVSDFAAERLTGRDVIARPHLTAHLVDDGPGAEWVARHCDGEGDGFAVCAFRDRLPTDWIAFLFSDRPDRGAFQSADALPPVRRALSEEDASFALAVLRDDPLGTTAFLGSAALEQLVRVRFEDVPLAGESLEARLDQFPPSVTRQGGGRIAGDAALLSVMSDVSAVAALVSALALAAAIGSVGRTARPWPGLSPLLWVCAVAVAGLILNAAICGALASPYDRFQSRVILLLPALAAVLWAARSRRLPSSPRALDPRHQERIAG